MARFLTELLARSIPPTEPPPDLADAPAWSAAEDRWQLTAPLLYESDVAGVGTMAVPAGFVTDLESVPRTLPLAYALLRGTAKRAAVLHDWLYSGQFVPRATADAVLYEAAVVDGAGPWRAWLLWVGVRVGGWAAYASYARLHAEGAHARDCPG